MNMVQIAHSKSKEEKLLRVLFIALIFSVMNAFLFNVVLPVISIEFNLSAAQVSWILSGYMIVYAFGTVIYGKLADKYRLKDLLTFGLLLFALGSVIGFVSTQYYLVNLGCMHQQCGEL